MNGGVSFSSMEQLKQFIQLFVDLFNHSRKPENRGFTPNELSARMEPSTPRSVIIYPNISKAIADGILF